MIKKAMVLAAGLGTRLRPLTEVYPKPLVPIANEPLLGIHLQALASLGVEEVMVNLHHLPDRIEDALGDGAAYGVRLHYSRETPEILGTGGGLAQVSSFFAGEEAFYFINGDILHDIDLSAALAAHNEHGAAATLLLRDHPLDGKTGYIGVAQDGWVQRVPDQPDDETLTRRMFTGMHILTPQIFPYLDQGIYGCVLRTGYRRMMEAGHRVWGHEIGDAAWRDIGNPASYLESNWWQLQQRTTGESKAALVGDDVTLAAGVVLGDNVILGEGAKIGANARLSHCVVLPGAEVAAESELKQAIVMPSQIVQVE